MKLWIGVFSR